MNFFDKTVKRLEEEIKQEKEELRVFCPTIPGDKEKIRRKKSYIAGLEKSIQIVRDFENSIRDNPDGSPSYNHFEGEDFFNGPPPPPKFKPEKEEKTYSEDIPF